MIRKIGQAFVLDTAHTTYAFSILPGGHPEHLYYGRTIHIEHPDDLEILVEKHVFAPGNVNICEKEHAGFSLEDALTLEQAQQLAEQGALRERMLPIERVFSSLPRLHLGGKQEQMYRNGVRLDLARLEGTQNFAGWQGDVAVFGEGGVFLGLSCPDWESQELRLHKLFAI